MFISVLFFREKKSAHLYYMGRDISLCVRLIKVTFSSPWEIMDCEATSQNSMERFIEGLERGGQDFSFGSNDNVKWALGVINMTLKKKGKLCNDVKKPVLREAYFKMISALNLIDDYIITSDML